MQLFSHQSLKQNIENKEIHDFNFDKSKRKNFFLNAENKVW
jgi:hypothetical protein